MFELGDSEFLSFHHPHGVREQIADHRRQQHPINERGELGGCLRRVEMLGQGDRFRILKGPEYDLGFVFGKSVPGFRQGEARRHVGSHVTNICD